MAFTYSPDTPRGRVRLLIFDTDEVTVANQIFTDAEIDAFLALENQEVYAAAAMACRSIGAGQAKSAIRYKVEKMFEIDKKDLPKWYLQLGETYMKRATEGEPWEIQDSVDYVIDRFGRDLSEYVGQELP